MHVRNFYQLDKYFYAGTKGIEWHHMRDVLLKKYEYQNLRDYEDQSMASKLQSWGYITKTDAIDETYAISNKGIDAYNKEKLKLDLLEAEKQKEKLFKEQLIEVNQSVIDTNGSVKKSNFWIPTLTAALVATSIIGLILDEIRYTHTQTQEQQWQTKMKLLDSTLQSHIEKDSFFQKEVKDSLKIHN